ncbi:MAG: tRNA epoxyqueuosine(34) reductase QueG [Aggregatilineales bacterium]
MIVSVTTLKARAQALGFSLVGTAPARPAPTLDAYHRWLALGMHGEMAYLARPDRLARRRDLNQIMPGAQSIVVVGLDYFSGQFSATALNDPARGRIAAYAWGLDYHDIMTPRLEELAAWLRGATGGASAQRVYVDTGAVLERSHGQQAGLGFVGKNTMLIGPRRGSYFFLGEIITTATFDSYETPHRQTLCGRCTRCLAECPTAAFPQPYVLDARRCISYLTIEYKGFIDPALRPLMGNWVFGCDICQDVCPWQRFAVETPELAFHAADLDRAAPPLRELLALDAAGFQARFRGTPLQRAGRDRLVRNACVAAGNSGLPDLFDHLARLLDDSAPVVRGHAAWALARLDAAAARPLLARRLAAETDPAVHDEVAACL